MNSTTKVILILIGLVWLISTSAQQPNIILIMADDHANRTISAYGDGINQTPNIDRIANEGAIFNNSFCANSICQPSRAAILTGKHSHKNGVFGNGSFYDNTQEQLPRILQNNGYKTAVIGKWHLKGEDPGDSFDYWNILTEGGGQGYYYNPVFKAQDGSLNQVEGYSTDVITDQSLAWLDANKDNPFCLMVHYKAPHVTRMPMIRNLELYEDETIPEPETLYDDYSTREIYASSAYNRLRYDIETTAYNYFPEYGKYNLDDYELLARMTEEQRQAYHAYYDQANKEYDELVANGTVVPGEKSGLAYAYQRFIKDYIKVVAGVDQNVERILDYIDEQNLTNNTIVLYCGDQSYFTGQHGYYEKRFIYEDAMKMPLLMRYPGHITAGTKVNDLVQNIDFAPTLLDFINIEVPEDMQGSSFKSVLEGNTPSDWRQAVYYHYYDDGKHGVPRHEGIRTHRYKLVNFYTDDAWELYDLQNDPNEINNVYKNPANAQLIKSLKIDLAQLKRQYEVPGSEERAEDFEGGDYKNLLAKLDWQLINSDGTTYRVMINPQLDAVNNTEKSGRLVRSGANEASQVQVHLGYEFYDLNTTRYVTLKLRSDFDNDFIFRLSKDGNNPFEFRTSIIGNKTWSDVTIDLTSIAEENLNNTYNQLDLIFAVDCPSVDGNVWFDEIEFKDNVSTDLEKIEPDLSLLYPNPTRGELFIKTPYIISQVEIFSLKGELVLKEEGENLDRVALNNLIKGNYLVRLTTNVDEKLVYKVMKI